MTRHILHIDLDAFFASVEQALNPELRGLPVVVGGHPNSRGVVAAASYEARPYGLKAGMPLTTAYRLCPQAVYLPGSYHLYEAFSKRFMDILADFTPDLEPMGIDEAFIDLTGFEPFYGPVECAAAVIKARIREELGITASVGIAACKVVAKVASDANKPDGLTVVTPGQEAAFLAPRPVRQLPCVGPKTEQSLKNIGVQTIGQLAQLPLDTLKGMFGVYGDVMYRWSKGIDDSRVRSSEDPQKSISRETTLYQDTLSRPLLRALLYYLSERVAAELREMDRSARCVTLKLRYADFDTITRSRTLKDPTDSHQNIFQMGQELMERNLGEKGKLVRLIGIGVSNLVGEGRQLGLMSPYSRKQMLLNRTLDRIRERYGFSAIQTGITLALRERYPTEAEGYALKTSALSR